MFEVGERFSLTLYVGWRVVDREMPDDKMETIGRLPRIQQGGYYGILSDVQTSLGLTSQGGLWKLENES